jgi:hypothetical protein
MAFLSIVIKTTEQPIFDAAQAASIPACPAPTTITFVFIIFFNLKVSRETSREFLTGVFHVKLLFAYTKILKNIVQNVIGSNFSYDLTKIELRCSDMLSNIFTANFTRD